MDQFHNKDSMIPKWKDVKACLVPYPSDKTGFMLDQTHDFAMPHRHFSRLLMIHDLMNVVWDPVENATLSGIMHRSLDNWSVSIKFLLQGV